MRSEIITTHAQERTTRMRPNSNLAYLSKSKLSNDCVPLLGRSVGVHDVHVDAVEDQFIVQLFRALFALQKDKHRWFETSLNQLP